MPCINSRTRVQTIVYAQKISGRAGFSRQVTLGQFQKFQNGRHPSYSEELILIQCRKEDAHATKQYLLDVIIALHAHTNGLQLYVRRGVGAMGRFMLNNLIAREKVRV